ncbi:hypothetical protein [Candidatus Pelagibacter sp. Uisw_127]|uniref:hypothetical protein n=1 Tax=Candidatus Pelagibacter sp. Uisw_127 TaxID=3230988 RepID=UPI0039ECEA6A
MNRLNQTFKLIIIFLIIQTNAFAYFDPGSGSYLIQLFIAFIASCYVFLSNPIQFIKSFFNKDKKITKNNEKNKSKTGD